MLVLGNCGGLKGLEDKAVADKREFTVQIMTVIPTPNTGLPDPRLKLRIITNYVNVVTYLS